MTLSSKQITGVLAVLAVGVGGWFLARDAGPYIMGVALVGAISVLFAGAAGPAAGPALQGLVDAAKRAGSGEKPTLPPGATGEMLHAYEALALIAEQRIKDQGELAA